MGLIIHRNAEKSSTDEGLISRALSKKTGVFLQGKKPKLAALAGAA
ncbi:hypothetical protein [Actibacterium atlanticum]|nr:hypothetical protein [Actibacterium atlanticum]